MTYTAVDIAQVLEIPGCKRISAQQKHDSYIISYELPDKTKFTVMIIMEEIK